VNRNTDLNSMGIHIQLKQAIQENEPEAYAG